MSESQSNQLKGFCEQIGVTIQNLTLLTEALTHRSYVNENRGRNIQHNERLEFLGDAVLELVSTEFLFSKYPDRPEGELTSFRAALVRTESLAETAAKMKYGEYIYMSKGEESTGGRSRPYILANTFEAVIGAIYLDQGYDASRDFLNRVLLPKIDEIVANRLDVDPKSKLQEVAQEMLKATPVYELVNEAGPDHDKTFTMRVILADKEVAQGDGKSKQEAEQSAARKALANWGDLYPKNEDSVKIKPTKS